MTFEEQTANKLITTLLHDIPEVLNTEGYNDKQKRKAVEDLTAKVQELLYSANSDYLLFLSEQLLRYSPFRIYYRRYPESDSVRPERLAQWLEQRTKNREIH